MATVYRPEANPPAITPVACYCTMTCCATPNAPGLRWRRYSTVQPTITVAPQPVVRPKTTPTPIHIVEVVLDEFQLTPDDVFYDLGCGDGRLLVRAARRYGCRCVGIDISQSQARKTLEAVRAAGLEDLVSVYCDDVTRCNVSTATAAYVYLEPATIARVVPRLPADCMVASYSHALADADHRVVVDGQTVYFRIR